MLFSPNDDNILFIYLQCNAQKNDKKETLECNFLTLFDLYSIENSIKTQCYCFALSATLLLYLVFRISWLKFFVVMFYTAFKLCCEVFRIGAVKLVTFLERYQSIYNMTLMK